MIWLIILFGLGIGFSLLIISNITEMYVTKMFHPDKFKVNMGWTVIVWTLFYARYIYIFYGNR